MTSPDWSGSSGDIWARRWRDTDRALAAVGAALDEAISEAAPTGSFRALDIGCGPGTTALSLAGRRPDASILGCDLSEALVEIARERAVDMPGLRFVAQDAEVAARENGPFDLMVSRHGVMFFDDPVRVFRVFRDSVAPTARLVFSCFQSWESNPWASEIAAAAAGAPVPAPGREPSGFAFSDPDYVRDILDRSGWTQVQDRSLDFGYVAGSGPESVAQALDFLVELGPAARIIEGLSGDERADAVQRIHDALLGFEQDGRVAIPGAAWIWSATAR